MKKIIAIMLLLVLLCGILVGCREETPEPPVDGTQDPPVDNPQPPETPTELEPIEYFDGIEYSKNISARTTNKCAYFKYPFDWSIDSLLTNSDCIFELVITEWVENIVTDKGATDIECAIYKSYVFDVIKGDSDYKGKTITLSQDTSMSTAEPTPLYTVGNHFLFIANKKDFSSFFINRTGEYFHTILPGAAMDVVNYGSTMYIMKWFQKCDNDDIDKYLISDTKRISDISEAFKDEKTKELRKDNKYFIYPYDEFVEYLQMRLGG